MSCQSPIVVALDYTTMAQSIEMAKRLDSNQCREKVGKQLYITADPAILESLHELEFEVFLDFKFHDIPNTVAKACESAAELGVWMVNVHASGGEKMMTACRERLEAFGTGRPLLIAVTVLTSMNADDLAVIGITDSPETQVSRLATLTKNCGLDGVVCSAQEAPKLKAEQGADFKLITPGIRPLTADKGDQQRIMTPTDALKAGSDYLVIGRPITQANDPLAALEAIHSEVIGL